MPSIGAAYSTVAVLPTQHHPQSGSALTPFPVALSPHPLPYLPQSSDVALNPHPLPYRPQSSHVALSTYPLPCHPQLDYRNIGLVLWWKEVQKIKSSLDTYAQHEDLFLKQLASKMKEKFDKYWGDCNLLMAIAAVLDPTKKMLAIEFCFPKLYSEIDASKHISKVKEIINSLYEKYVVEETNKGVPHPSESESFGSSSVKRNQQSSVYSWDDFDDYCAKVETSETKRSELVDYLEKGRLKKNEIPKIFSCLEWWKMNRMQYPILSKMAADILAIPVSSVASEATFSTGTRVIDSYCSSLSPDTVQALLCGGD
ncbi:hypothetical protein ZIOFF_041811 [Zingiber officinale]|uniref:Uncharacterized protein n=1 Tax=Zingiber officinale TaxID=94328 RepID=A0A8J5L1T3_ZINOF|nr:hypothetical protein ZIOFF_041811 [Zingiber officinale]